MRLRMFVLIAVCVVLDVLVVRQVRQYDEQKMSRTYEHSLRENTRTVASHKKLKARQAEPAQESESSATAC